MAVRKPGKVAAPVKQKQRKNHGPKKHMFKDFKPMVVAFARTGILSKFYNYESFVQSLAFRGVRSMTRELWADFSVLSYEAKKEFLKNIQAQETLAIKRKAEQDKKLAKKAQKSLPKQAK